MRPSSITSEGTGSFGPSKATRPSSASGSISTSPSSSRAARASYRADRRSAGKEAPLAVHGEALPHERRGRRGVPLVEPDRPVLELGGGRPPRAQRGVDGEDRR